MCRCPSPDFGVAEGSLVLDQAAKEFRSAGNTDLILRV
jgi:hypothetical protein